MIISQLHNDVLKKKEFWLSFSENHGFDFKCIQTPSKDVNKLKIVFSFKDIKVSFLETDAKPLVCEFEISTDRKKIVEINQITMLDRLFSLFKKKHSIYANSFFDKNIIKSSDSDKKDLKVKMTTTYFVDSYEKLDDIYSITCRIIEHLK